MALFKKAFEKLSAGLARTRQRFTSSIKSLLVGRSIDPQLLDELEATLIQADIGVASARQIRQDLEAARADKRIAKGEDRSRVPQAGAEEVLAAG